MWFLILSVCALVYITHKIIWQWTYWEKKGAPYARNVPIFGHLTTLLLGKGNIKTMFDNIYKSRPDKRYVGFFQMFNPVLIIRDPELIKQITVKDFEYFSEHMQFTSAEQDPLWSKNLFASKTAKWRELRPSMSPVFTASKLRTMVGLMEEVAQQLVAHLETRGEEVHDVDVKDMFSRCTNDVIATTAFGLKCDSFREQQNEFFLMGKDIANFGGGRAWKIVGNRLMPSVMKFFNVQLFTKSTIDYFRKIIEGNIEERLAKGIVRPDLINVLLEARKSGLKYEEQEKSPEASFAEVQESELGKRGQTKTISDEDIVAQALVFFLAGYDMVANITSLVMHEVALHPDIQDNLRKDINQHWTDELNISKMKYLDMVISETMRKWVPVILTDRMAVKPYVIEPKLPGEKPVLVDEGTLVLLPVWAIHMDPKYYPEPDKFDPERFSDENKGKIIPGTYLPFGIGPRNCIGSRFALMEIKILVAYVLRNYEVFPTKKTQIPLEVKRRAVSFQVPGFWLGFKKTNVH